VSNENQVNEAPEITIPDVAKFRIEKLEAAGKG